MLAFEIILIIASVSIVVGVFGKYIYDVYHGKDPDCDVCKAKGKKALKNIKKELNKEFK